MAIGIAVTAKQGEVKTICAEDVFGDMRADALWFSENADTIESTPHVLSNEDREWIVWRIGEWVQIEITCDSNLPDGQGLVSPFGGANVTVEGVSGDVYIVRRKHISYSDNKAKIYESKTRVTASVGDEIQEDDALLGSNESKFVFRLLAPGDGSVHRFVGIALVSSVLESTSF